MLELAVLKKLNEKVKPLKDLKINPLKTFNLKQYQLAYRTKNKKKILENLKLRNLAKNFEKFTLLGGDSKTMLETNYKDKLRLLLEQQTKLSKEINFIHSNITNLDILKNI